MWGEGSQRGWQQIRWLGFEGEWVWCLQRTCLVSWAGWECPQGENVSCLQEGEKVSTYNWLFNICENDHPTKVRRNISDVTSQHCGTGKSFWYLAAHKCLPLWDLKMLRSCTHWNSRSKYASYREICHFNLRPNQHLYWHQQGKEEALHSVLKIPPTRAALEQHVKRASFQGGHVWGHSLLFLLPVAGVGSKQMGCMNRIGPRHPKHAMNLCW